MFEKVESDLISCEVQQPVPTIQFGDSDTDTASGDDSPTTMNGNHSWIEPEPPVDEHNRDATNNTTQPKYTIIGGTDDDYPKTQLEILGIPETNLAPGQALATPIIIKVDITNEENDLTRDLVGEIDVFQMTPEGLSTAVGHVATRCTYWDANDHRKGQAEFKSVAIKEEGSYVLRMCAFSCKDGRRKRTRRFALDPVTVGGTAPAA
ncbi:hypothetical protein FQN50_006608 [Emmonsiellopsis sp. PD_5]|nr:hypothetical protein FQN50_006608 [Emmonsiellopsis sp. PD_5]